MHNYHAARRLAFAAILIALPGFAAAADLPQAQSVPVSEPTNYTLATPDWIVSVGGGVGVGPAWPGASRYSSTGMPRFGVRKGQLGTPPAFSGARDGVGFPLLNLDQFKVGPSFKFIARRKASDYTQLNGLPDVGFALQAGGFAEFWPVPWLRLRGDVRQGFGGEKGITGDAALDAVVLLGGYRFSGGPRLTAQSSKAVTPYFSITPSASIGSTVAGLPQLPVYDAKGGLYSYGAGGKIEHFINEHWSAYAFGEYERLTGSVADSPLVTMRGSPNQFTGGLGVTYSFAARPLW
jgi:outer membrane protein